LGKRLLRGRRLFTFIREERGMLTAPLDRERVPALSNTERGRKVGVEQMSEGDSAGQKGEGGPRPHTFRVEGTYPAYQLRPQGRGEKKVVLCRGKMPPARGNRQISSSMGRGLPLTPCRKKTKRRMFPAGKKRQPVRQAGGRRSF